ncbi:ATP-binding protein [Ekhidna sp.]|uniref:sacsin N-terminal ATP-binding-like domain-containing protein n=1 Tax=Ekhidna sp. TaxID=2608089 RepID=UPI0032988F7B
MIQSIEEGRKEDGNRSIADKIIRRLHDLDKTVENNKGRWAWELLQNAKDSIADEEEKTVSVEIELNNDNIEFRHNGTHFTEQDVRGLINQISSKEVEEHETTKKTGRFGTGFITTHLLSRVIDVKGILKAADSNYYSFEFPLDRSAKTTSLFIPKIEEAWNKFHTSARQLTSYDPENFNTTFNYQLITENQKDIARLGIEEFSLLVPYVLAFIPKISSIEIIDNKMKTISKFSNTTSYNSSIKEIIEDKNGQQYKRLILFRTNEKVSVAAEIEKTDNFYKVLSTEGIPKLFCDFPLIGSEKFYFPVVVNSFFFNPLTEREGVWLKGNEDKEVIENQEILLAAVELYKELIADVESNNFTDLYNMADTRLPVVIDKYIDFDWYETNIQKPLRDVVYKSKLVESEESKEQHKSINETWFPRKSYTKKVADQIWKFTYDLFPDSVCKKNHIHQWLSLSWNEWKYLDYEELLKDIQNLKSIMGLSDALKLDEDKCFEWLNEVGTFLLEDESNEHYLNKYDIIPNANGNFRSVSDFKGDSNLFIDKIKDPDLVKILKLLGEDWDDILIHNKVGFGKYHSKKLQDIAARITEVLSKAKEKDDGYIEAISMLSEWFDNNELLGKEHFSDLYRKKADLFMNTIKDKEGLYQIMKSGADLTELAKVATSIQASPIEVEGLSNLLNEYHIDNLTQLKEILENSQTIGGKLELTQEMLAGLGISSQQELEVALEDKDLKAMFTHTSTPSVEMFLYAQSLISRAKENVLKHLHKLPQYDCSEMEELAHTVIGGIKKDGLLIQVVIRPSDHGEVIVYYTSEKDTLDYENAELWIDNGIQEPKHLTLGRILKTTGINRIPV